MHWFWRAAIAGVVGSIFGAWNAELPLTPVRYFIAHSVQRLTGHLIISFAVLYYLPAIVVAGVVYGILTYRFNRHHNKDTETLCRKCGYILRGLSEPRCPECGERI